MSFSQLRPASSSQPVIRRSPRLIRKSVDQSCKSKTSDSYGGRAGLKVKKEDIENKAPREADKAENGAVRATAKRKALLWKIDTSQIKKARYEEVEKDNRVFKHVYSPIDGSPIPVIPLVQREALQEIQINNTTLISPPRAQSVKPFAKLERKFGDFLQEINQAIVTSLSPVEDSQVVTSSPKPECQALSVVEPPLEPIIPTAPETTEHPSPPIPLFQDAAPVVNAPAKPDSQPRSVSTETPPGPIEPPSFSSSSSESHPRTSLSPAPSIKTTESATICDQSSPPRSVRSPGQVIKTYANRDQPFGVVKRDPYQLSPTLRCPTIQRFPPNPSMPLTTRIVRPATVDDISEIVDIANDFLRGVLNTYPIMDSEMRGAFYETTEVFKLPFAVFVQDDDSPEKSPMILGYAHAEYFRVSWNVMIHIVVREGLANTLVPLFLMYSLLEVLKKKGRDETMGGVVKIEAGPPKPADFPVCNVYALAPQPPVPGWSIPWAEWGFVDVPGDDVELHHTGQKERPILYLAELAKLRLLHSLG